MRALTLVHRDRAIAGQETVDRKDVAARTVHRHVMAADRKAAAVADRMMVLASVGRKVAAVAQMDAAPKDVDLVGPMARRDHQIRSGSSTASMRTKMAR